MIKIFISEEIPSLNKGEAAILSGAIESFRHLGNDIEISLLSFHAEVDELRYKDKVKIIDGTKDLYLKKNFEKSTVLRLFGSIFVLLQYITFIILYKIFGLKVLRIMRNKLWEVYSESDLIIIGHDSALSGMFGTIPFLLLYSLFIAKLLKKPIVMYAGSAETFGNIFQLYLAKYMLNQVDLITLREEPSYKYLNSIGINMEHTFLTADLAYLLPPAPPDRVKEIISQEGIDKSGLLIGMTVTREICCLAFTSIKNKEQRYKKSVHFISQVIDYLTGTLNATVILIPHCIGPGEERDDRIVSEDIYQSVQNKRRLKKITKEYTAEELKGLIGQLDMFIGERLHSIVGAVSMYVPSIAILFPSARNELLAGILDKKHVCNIETMDFDSLVLKINGVFIEKEEIKRSIPGKMRTMREHALTNGRLLKNLLGSGK
jgi:colanic acid/amylovoran biosynthesis protein